MMSIREGTMDDFKKLNHDWAWGDSKWQRKAQQKTIDAIMRGEQSFVVVEGGDNLIGELHIEWNKPEDKDAANGKTRAYLFALRIHPDRRRQGLGTKLMEEALNLILKRGYTEVTIGTYKDEDHLRKLYNKWGFTEYLKDALEETDEYSKYYELYLKHL